MVIINMTCWKENEFINIFALLSYSILFLFPMEVVLILSIIFRPQNVCSRDKGCNAISCCIAIPYIILMYPNHLYPTLYQLL